MRLTVCLALSCLWLLTAQEPSRPKFEVASVKKSRPGMTNWTWHSTAEGYSTENEPLDSIICWAYHIKRFQLIGGPKWIQDGYDINAKAGRRITNEERMQMVQSLLEDRFHLTMKQVNRQASLYEMVIAKSGSRLNPSRCHFGEDPTCGRYTWNANDISGAGIEPADLASMLTDSVDLPVVDKTGISGRFDVKLHWAPADDAGAEVADASIFTAIQEQLGLKLEFRKGPVRMLQIEHVERPDEKLTGPAERRRRPYFSTQSL